MACKTQILIIARIEGDVYISDVNWSKLNFVVYDVSQPLPAVLAHTAIYKYTPSDISFAATLPNS